MRRVAIFVPGLLLIFLYYGLLAWAIARYPPKVFGDWVVSVFLLSAPDILGVVVAICKG